MGVIRGSSLKARLSRTLVGLGLVSVLLLATVNFFVVRGLLDRGVTEQLVTLRDMRRDSIELGVDRLLTRVAVLGTDNGVASSLDSLASAYDLIDDELTDEQLADLEEAYGPIVDRYDAAGVPRPPVPDLLPSSIAGRYLQHEYIAAQPADGRAETIDAGDGSTYSAVHAEVHEFLSELAADVGASDLMLVDSGGEVVYSVAKHVDFGTNVATGAYADTGLGTTWTGLGRAALTEAVLADSEFYLPNSSAPVVHVASTVRSGSEVVGAVIATIQADVLTSIVTAEQQWDQLGLGETGEAYLVGTDRTLRTVPRPWFDDASGYIDRFIDIGGDERTAGLMEFTGSPVLLQETDNEAVRSALDGNEFIGTVDNYLGESTLTATAPIKAGDVGWIVVTEQQTSETRDELERFALAIGILLVVLLPILALVGIVLARVLARPVRPLVDAAGHIADGDYDTAVPDLGRTELGDVGRQLEAVAAQLREQEDSIAAEEDRITTMLASLLPPDLVEHVRRGDQELGDVVDTGTVIAITVRGLPEPTGVEQDVLVELTARAAEELAILVGRFGIERARVAPEQLTFVAGRGVPDDDANNAAAFAVEVLSTVDRVGTELGVGVTAHGGLASGLVATGMLGSQQVAFGVWGECVGRSIELSHVAGAGEVLADAAVVEGLDERWDAMPSDDDHGWGRPDDQAYRIAAVADTPTDAAR